jgi:hypothetical protein
MVQPLPLVLVPGLICSARLYAPQIAALWPFGPVMVADHRRDAAIAPPRFVVGSGEHGAGRMAGELKTEHNRAFLLRANDDR